MGDSSILASLALYFQEYDIKALDASRDATLIIQRTLEHGSWREIRWLFERYGVAQVCHFVAVHGQRMLSPVAFSYWRKLLGVEDWKPSPFATARNEVWVG